MRSVCKKRDVRNWKKEEETNLSQDFAAKVGKVIRVIAGKESGVMKIFL